MIAFALQSANLPFTVALGVMILIGVMEAAGMMFGASISSAIDSLLPDADIDFDVDIDGADGVDIDGPELDAPDLDGVGGVALMLDWLCVGRVPMLILLVVFLCSFGVAGLLIQGVVHGLTGWLLPGILASAPAFAIALPMVHVAGRGFEKVFPKAETYVVSEASFIGEVATVTLGTAEVGKPAQAKLTDRYDRTHYVQVEPDEPETSFETGSQVLLVRREGAVFKVIQATGGLVSDG